MILKVLITGKNLKPFTGDEGEEIPYCWYKTEDIADQTTRQIGSAWTQYEIGEEVELNVEKRESIDKKGKRRVRYVEIRTQ